MANSIVFSNSAEELKTSVFGYDGSNYLPLKVNQYGELDINVGTISKIDSITNGTVDVTQLSSLTNGTITKVSSITNGTVDVTQLSSLTGGTITNISSITNGSVNVNITDRYFNQTSETVATIASATPQYSTAVDTSKMQDITWYVKKVAGGTMPVTVSVAVCPEQNGTYVLVGETATVGSVGSAKALSSSYYMHYTRVYCTTAATTNQSVQVFFNGRY
ncbi:hypothetical protein EXQ36_03375 [Clostridium botulinum]|nr:hypothetical protein [Clostridium botulinum]